jgi:secondary thiamine-phosphate synthase enzyme
MAGNDFSVNTREKVQFVNITSSVSGIVAKNKIKDGLCIVYVPHTTAGVTINESADPAVVHDIITMCNKLIPFHANYTHFEGNSAAHIKASLVGSSVNIPINNGQLVLGTWQGIFFCEFDGPRNRRVIVKLIANKG